MTSETSPSIEQLLLPALEAAGVGVWEWRLDGGAPVASAACYTMLGYDVGEWPATLEVWVSMIHPDDRAPIVAEVQRTVAQGLPLEVSYRMRAKSGEWRWMLCRGSPVQRDAEGRSARVVGTQLDITPLKRAEEALRESEERYRELIQSQGEGIGIVDAEERFVFANPAAEAIFGLPAGGMVGRSLAEFIEPEELRSIQRQTERRRAGQADTYEMSFTRADGSRRILLVTATPRFDERRGYIGAFGVFRDLTERKQTEEALRESEERYRELIEALPHGVGILQHGAIAFANPAALRLLGYRTLSDLRGLDPLAPLVESERERVLASLADLRSGRVRGPVHYETRIRRTDGAEIPTAAYVTAITFRGAPALQLFFMDLTERERLEQERARLEERLRGSQKLESIGRLAGGIAHDFNNLLSPILLHSELALRELGPDDSRHEDFEEIHAAATRGKNLTQQLLAFGRKQLLRVDLLDLNQVVRESTEMLRRLIREDVAIQLDLEPTLGRTRADRTQLQQVLLNLALNARDAMPGGGEMLIRTENVSLTKDPEFAAGPYVMLSVRDSGAGMDRETQRRLFEPFFTTKGLGHGTGLGLATVHGIVNQHGGHILVESAPGEGAEFRVYLPRADLEAPASEAPAPARAPEAPPRFDHTVLVVEDNELMRSHVCRTLRRMGFDTLSAADAEQALSLAAGHEAPIHLLLTDVILPGLDGRELFRRLAGARPDLRAVFMSGYADDVIADDGVLDREIHFLQKPFSVDDLVHQLRRALGV